MPMAGAQPPIYEEVHFFLVSSPTPDEILAFCPTQATQERGRSLLEAGKAGQQTELDDFEQVEHFVRMLNLHTRKKISLG